MIRMRISSSEQKIIMKYLRSRIFFFFFQMFKKSRSEIINNNLMIKNKWGLIV